MDWYIVVKIFIWLHIVTKSFSENEYFRYKGPEKTHVASDKGRSYRLLNLHLELRMDFRTKKPMSHITWSHVKQAVEPKYWPSK